MKKLIAVTVVLALLSGACSSDEPTAQTTGEQAAAEDAQNDEVEETPQVEVTGEQQDGSTVPSGVELPSGFPVPIPDGGTGTWTGISPDNGAAALSYSPGSFDEIVAFYDDWASEAGDDLLSTESGEDPAFVAWTVQTDSHYLNVTVGDNGTEVTLAVYVSPQGRVSE